MEPTEKKTKNLGIRASVDRWRLLNRLALDRDSSVQALIDEAIERWLAGEVPDEKDEQKMKTGTKTAEGRHQIGTFNQTVDPIDHKIVQSSTNLGQTEIKSGERILTEVPSGYADSARTAATVESFKADIGDLRDRLARIEQHLTRAEKTAKKSNRSRRVVPRRARKHPPGAQSGA